MGMNLSAIRPRGAAVQEQAEHGIAQRNRGATNGNLLFRDTAPVLEAIANGLRAEPVQATEGGLATALKAMAGEIEKTVAAMKAPAPAAVAAPAPVRSTGSPPSVPMLTETQRRREAEAREQTRKAAAQAAADRVLVSKGGAKVLTLRALDATLSDNALIALTHIIGKWTEAGRRPVRVRASDVSGATDMSSANAQAALDELDAKKAIVTSINSAGIRLLMPGLGVAGA